MKLMTKAIADKLPGLNTTDGTDATVVVKFFTPWSYWTWYAVEGEQQGNDWLFFGLVVGHESELGYFRLSELASVKGPFGLRIERDRHFDPTPLNVIRNISEGR